MYIVSACLLGRNCKYNGGNNETEEVVRFLKGKQHIPVCPECMGGLPVPRKPVEINTFSGRYIDINGSDKTEEFCSGAVKALEAAKKYAEEKGEKIEAAILKSKSPSCGRGEIYDGSFRGKIVYGNGAFAQLLIDEGIEIYNEKEIS